MGAWNVNPFGNDAALDWLWELESNADGASFIGETLDTVIDNDDSESRREEEAVAAAAIVAAASADPVGRLAKDAKSWVLSKGFVPDIPLIDKAIRALDALMADSELRELWEESGSLKSWLKNTKGLVDTLNIAKERDLPVRKPKKKGMPRVLYKMIDAYAKEPDEKLKSKIHQKLNALEDVNQSSKETDHELPLNILAKKGLVEEIKMLLDRGADPNLGDMFGFPLAFACGNNHLAAARLLVDGGAEIFKEIMIDAKTRRQVEFMGENEHADPVVFKYSQALFSAARSGGPDIIDYLLSLGADLNQEDLNGETLLHKACESGNIEAAEHLIHLGLDVNKVKPHCNETALHYAVRAKQVESVHLLLESGADPNIVEKWDGTVLDMVKEKPDSALFRLIRSFGGKFSEEIRNDG